VTSHVVIVAILHATQPHVMVDPTLDDNDIFAHNVITSDLPTESECIVSNLRRTVHANELTWAVVLIAARDSHGRGGPTVDWYETERDAKHEAESLAADGEEVYVMHACWQSIDKVRR